MILYFLQYHFSISNSYIMKYELADKILYVIHLNFIKNY